jgi:tetratricopeptide (TPR) repeat protein
MLAWLSLFLSSCDSGQQATATVNQETITTYPFSDPDPIPVFARSSLWGSGSRIYPYFVFNGFSAESRLQDWTVVRLKNKFIEVSILPEVGGKVWGATDLITGRQFLYTNRVLKFREISLRGPWTSGGIEFNFGIIGHAPSTATPVDYLLEKKPDGRLVCTVGNYDWPSRTRWQVAITVYPDRAYFETRARWTNPGPYRQSYYAWMCPAVPVSPDLKYIFPGKYQIGHDYSVPLEPWPIEAEGRDLSWYRNNNFGGSKSYFVVGHYEHFYGGYYQASDSGFGHQALYSDMPGKKIWIWDLSRAGEIWVDLLTDADGQYTEPQSGRLLNQSDHGTFFPATSDSWKELWFPYSGIGPMAGAAAGVVLSLNPKDNGLELGIYALENIKEKIIIKQGEKEIQSQTIYLRPAEKTNLHLAGISSSDDLTIYLGQKIIHQPLRARELLRPFNFHRPTGDSPESLYLAAQTLENERDYSAALDKYRQVIEMVPDHLLALTRLAELHLRRGEYQKALSWARRSLEISMYDPEANYVYGLVSRRLNLPTEARESFGWASRSPALCLPACLQLAEIALADGDFSQAEEYARRAINYDRENPLPLELLAVALRLQQRKKEARQVCRQILELEPLNHLARYELYLLQPDPGRLDDFRKFIRNEFPAETYLELSLFYLRTGQPDRSVELLSRSPENPEVLAWLAYLQQDPNPDRSQAALEKSAVASPWLVFPFREESIPVLEWAAARKPDCWKFRYYLGLVFWHKGRLEEARQLFSSLDDADYYPVFIARAYLNPDDRAAAYRDLQRAWQLAPEAWRTWHHLIKHELDEGLKSQALSHSLAALEKFPDNMYLQSDAVKALLTEARYREAANLLDRMQVLPYEGASEVHSLFVRTHLHLALDLMLGKNWNDALKEIDRSRDYPEQLGTGRPYEPDQRIQDYLEALCYEALNQKEKARKKYLDIIDYSRKFPAGPYAGVAQLAGKKVGLKAKTWPQASLASLPGEFRSKILKLAL